MIPTAEKMASAHKQDPDFSIVRQLIEIKESLSVDKLAALSLILKCFAEILGKLIISAKDVLLRSSLDDVQQVVTIVQNTFVIQVI